MKFLENTKVQLIVIAVVIGFSIFKTIGEKSENNSLKGDGTYTIAKIINHSVIGYAEAYYVEYEFFVNNKKYVKSVNYSRKFIDCYKTKECIGRKFVVYYNRENPDEAYVDFNDER